MASLRKRGEVWYVRYRDQFNKQVEIKAGPDRAVARRMANELEGRVQGIKAGTIDPAIVEQQEAARRPIEEHVNEWHDYLINVRRREARDASIVRGQVLRVLKFARVRRLGEVTFEAVCEGLARVRRTKGRSGREALSDRTAFHYVRAIKAFTAWAVKKRRFLRNPLSDLEMPAVHDARERRALDPDDAAALIRSAREAPDRFGLAGEDRSMLYLVALISGFRAGELRQLKPEDFHLSGDCPEIVLSGRSTKNDKDAAQRVPTALVPALAAWLASKPTGEPVWGHLTRLTAEMIRVDLGLANINNYKGYNFHTLRNTMVTMVVRSGAGTKEAQALARHADVRLTLGTYTHLLGHDVHAAINKHPLAHALPTTGVSACLTGTHDGPVFPGQNETREDTARPAVGSGGLMRGHHHQARSALGGRARPRRRESSVLWHSGLRRGCISGRRRVRPFSEGPPVSSRRRALVPSHLQTWSNSLAWAKPGAGRPNSLAVTRASATR
jgi:integrase